MADIARSAAVNQMGRIRKVPPNERVRPMPMYRGAGGWLVKPSPYSGTYMPLVPAIMRHYQSGLGPLSVQTLLRAEAKSLAVDGGAPFTVALVRKIIARTLTAGIREGLAA